MQTQETARFAAMMTRSAELKRRIATELADTVIKVVDVCEASLRAGGKLMFCGNGGSAADSQHLATEMLIRLRPKSERPSIAALALTLDPAMLTACGNDYGYDRVFERPSARTRAAAATCCSASPPRAGPRMSCGRWKRRGRWGS